MRRFVLALASAVFAILFAASAAAANVRLPGVSSLVTHQNEPTIVPRSEAWKYRNPAVVPLSIQQAAIVRRVEAPRAPMRVPRGHTVTSYLSDDYGYIFELAGKKVVGYYTDCAGAEGIKVDHDRNLWAACTNTSTVNMYAPGAGSATLTLRDNPGGLDYYTADVAVDGAGDVYASSLYAFQCTTYYCYFYPGQISYWAASDVKNGASPTGTIVDPNINQEAFFIDADAEGSSLYVDYYACNTATCGYAVDKITGTSIVTLFPLGGLSSAAGIYVTADGNINIVDDAALTIDVYDSSGNRLGDYGPMTHACGPSGLGFNLGDTEVVLADAGCQAEIVGKLDRRHGRGSFKEFTNIDFALPIGAAFTPSDK